MAFKFSFEENAEIHPMPFILKSGKQPIVLTALHFGKNETLRIKVNNKELYSFIEKDGINNFDIPVNVVAHKDSVFINVSVGKKNT